jgi:hypothetical protein
MTTYSGLFRYNKALRESFLTLSQCKISNTLNTVLVEYGDNFLTQFMVISQRLYSLRTIHINRF